MNPILLGLAIALAVSVAGNTALGWAWLSARDQAAALEVERDQAQGAANTCSKGVADMQTRAAASARAGAATRAAAAASAAAGDRRADEILASAPSAPADDCKSAQDQVDLWLKGRGP